MSGQKITSFGVCSDFDSRVIAWLRRRHPAKVSENISSDTGISVNTVRKWFSHECRPNALAIFRLIAAYGPEFLLAAYPKAPAWLDAAARAQRLAALDAQLAALQDERGALCDR